MAEKKKKVGAKEQVAKFSVEEELKANTQAIEDLTTSIKSLVDLQIKWQAEVKLGMRAGKM